MPKAQRDWIDFRLRARTNSSSGKALADMSHAVPAKQVMFATTGTEPTIRRTGSTDAVSRAPTIGGTKLHVIADIWRHSTVKAASL